MKKLTNQFGVTLLEIMLVLAVAAMVIVMSIRYYQSSSSSQQANQVMESIQAIASAADNLANGGAGTYSSLSEAQITGMVGSASMTSPTNDPIHWTAASAKTYTVTIPLTTALCTSLLPKVQGMTKVGVSGASCGTDGTLSYTYNNGL